MPNASHPRRDGRLGLAIYSYGDGGMEVQYQSSNPDKLVTLLARATELGYKTNDHSKYGSPWHGKMITIYVPSGPGDFKTRKNAFMDAWELQIRPAYNK